MTAAPNATMDMPRTRQGLPAWVAFGLCVAILAGTAIFVPLAQSRWNIKLNKLPVPLRKSLDWLDKSKLGPYRFVSAFKLSDEMVEALETKDYINWELDDPRRPAGDPLRRANLFVTYYTGGRSQVPHIPDRCYLGGGFTPEGGTSIEFPVTTWDGKTETVPTRVLYFSKPGLVDVQKQTVVYTFYANCTFESAPLKLRWVLTESGLPKAFFSKVEVTFSGGDMGAASPDPQQAAQAAQELLQTVLPVLVREHWPVESELHDTPGPAAR